MHSYKFIVYICVNKYNNMCKQFHEISENTEGYIAQKEFDIISQFIGNGYSEEEIKHFFNFMLILAKGWKKPIKKPNHKVLS